MFVILPVNDSSCNNLNLTPALSKKKKKSVNPVEYGCRNEAKFESTYIHSLFHTY